MQVSVPPPPLPSASKGKRQATGEESQKRCSGRYLFLSSAAASIRRRRRRQAHFRWLRVLGVFPLFVALGISICVCCACVLVHCDQRFVLSCTGTFVEHTFSDDDSPCVSVALSWVFVAGGLVEICIHVCCARVLVATDALALSCNRYTC